VLAEDLFARAGEGVIRTPEKDSKTCRSQLAGDGFKDAAFIQIARVIVNDHREQARSLYVALTPVD
jgi:hypothetical protein